MANLPQVKPFNISSIDNLWRARWKYSDIKKGDIIERALMRSGRLAVCQGSIYSAIIVEEDVDCNPINITLNSLNINGSSVLTEKKLEDLDYLSEQTITMSDIQELVNMRGDALRTISSIMRKLRTPIMLKTTGPIIIEPCKGEVMLDSDIVSVSGGFNFENVDFQISGSISDVVQLYHDIESIGVKSIGIPATFLSRSSGMGQGEVDDASAIDDLIRERELSIRKDICSYLKMTVEWAIPKEDNNNVLSNTIGFEKSQNPI